MTWLLLKEATSNTALWRARLKIKGKDKTKWPKFPWTEKDPGKKYGQVNEDDSQAALDYLMSLSPPTTEEE